jgi:hypothetical protein
MGSGYPVPVDDGFYRVFATFVQNLNLICAPQFAVNP